MPVMLVFVPANNKFKHWKVKLLDSQEVEQCYYFLSTNLAEYTAHSSELLFVLLCVVLDC